MAEAFIEQNDSNTYLSISDYVNDFLNGDAISELTYLSTSLITILPSSAFANYNLLEYVNLSNVSAMYKHTFYNCLNLKECYLSQNYIIDESCFCNCSKLKFIDIGYTSVIYDYAFANCLSLEDINLSLIQEIRGHAFENCIKLNNSNILDMEKCYSIGESAFTNCNNLQDVRLNNIYTIYSYAFNSCNNLSILYMNLYIDAKISDSAFKDCDKLNTVYLNVLDSIYSYGSYKYLDLIFNNCQNLKNIHIKGTISSLYYITFSNIDDMSSCYITYDDVLTYGFLSFRNVNMPKCTSLTDTNFCENLSAPKLEYVGQLGYKLNVIDFPKLKEVKNIYLKSKFSTYISLPNINNKILLSSDFLHYQHRWFLSTNDPLHTKMNVQYINLGISEYMYGPWDTNPNESIYDFQTGHDASICGLFLFRIYNYGGFVTEGPDIFINSLYLNNLKNINYDLFNYIYDSDYYSRQGYSHGIINNLYLNNISEVIFNDFCGLNFSNMISHPGILIKNVYLQNCKKILTNRSEFYSMMSSGFNSSYLKKMTGVEWYESINHTFSLINGYALFSYQDGIVHGYKNIYLDNCEEFICGYIYDSIATGNPYRIFYHKGCGIYKYIKEFYAPKLEKIGAKFENFSGNFNARNLKYGDIYFENCTFLSDLNLSLFNVNNSSTNFIALSAINADRIILNGNESTTIYIDNYSTSSYNIKKEVCILASKLNKILLNLGGQHEPCDLLSCPNLNSTWYPYSVTHNIIYASMFKKVYMPNNMPDINYRGLVSFGSYNEEIICGHQAIRGYELSNLKKISIPNAERVYLTGGGNSYLTYLDLPNVISISGIHDFVNLKAINAPNCVSLISSYIFSGCSNLETINLDNCEFIASSYVFKDTKISTFILPKCSKLYGAALPETTKFIYLGGYYDGTSNIFISNPRNSNFIIQVPASLYSYYMSVSLYNYYLPSVGIYVVSAKS